MFKCVRYLPKSIVGPRLIAVGKGDVVDSWNYSSVDGTWQYSSVDGTWTKLVEGVNEQ